MRSRYARVFQIIILAGDLILLNGCFLLAAALRFDEMRIQDTEYYDYYVQLIVFFNLLWLFLSFLFRTYDTRRSLEPRKATGKVLNAYFLHLFLLLLLLVSLKKDEYSRLFLVYFYVSFFFTVLPWRFYFLRLLKAMRRRGISFKAVVLIGAGEHLARFYRSVQEHPEYGLKVIGYFCDEPEAGIPCTGKEKEAEGFLENTSVDEIYCAFPGRDERLLHWFRVADDHMIRYRVVPDLGIEHGTSVKIDYHHDVPVLVHRPEPLEYLHNRLLKRSLDILISLLVIVLVFSWLFPLLALGVKLSSRGPVFFKQLRTGVREGEFVIYKFRSMVVNPEADTSQAVADDLRITAFGRFLRGHHLDELPQFFNVLKGEMSVVGPRPHMLAHTQDYRRLIDRYMVRHFARPGITGLAQVRGLRGEVHSTGEVEERVRTDVYYIENWSLLLDFKIILSTIFQMLAGKN